MTIKTAEDAARISCESSGPIPEGVASLIEQAAKEGRRKAIVMVKNEKEAFDISNNLRAKNFKVKCEHVFFPFPFESFQHYDLDVSW